MSEIAEDELANEDLMLLFQQPDRLDMESTDGFDSRVKSMAAELLRRREAERQWVELCRIALTHCGPPDADYEEWELGYRLRAAIAKAEARPSDPSPEPVQGA